MLTAKHSRQTPYTIRYASSLTIINGARMRNRTPDLMLTRQLLYRLSYTGETYLNSPAHERISESGASRPKPLLELFQIRSDGPF